MYRAELFNMFTHSFVSTFSFEETVEIKEDYMSPQVFDIPAPADIEVELKNTLMIKRDTESYSVFRGFVKDIHRTDTETTITVAPMMMLLNEKSMQNTAHTAWRSQLYAQIYGTSCSPLHRFTVCLGYIGQHSQSAIGMV